MIQALPDGILNNLVTMINFMKEGEFVKANDIYLLTAIGNAPWPIGLTMVGIHERSGTRGIGCLANAPIHVGGGRAMCVSIQLALTNHQSLLIRKKPVFSKAVSVVVTGYQNMCRIRSNGDTRDEVQRAPASKKTSSNMKIEIRSSIGAHTRAYTKPLLDFGDEIRN